jgi:hypothetical protein
MNLVVAILLLVIQASPVATQPGRISGFVRDPSGNPEVGVRVAARSVVDDTEVLVALVQTDENGAYQMELTPGRYYILTGPLGRPWFHPGVANLESASPVSVVSGGLREELNFRMELISGLVRDDAGVGQADVRVMAVTGLCGGVVLASTQTDEDGRYRLGVFPGSYYIVAGQAERTVFKDNTPLLVQPRAPMEPVNFVLPPPRDSAEGGRATALLSQGIALMKRGCYESARLNFQVLAATYPESPVLPSSKFHFAESYFLDGKPAALAQARILFTEYLAAFPNSPHAADARQRLLEIDRELK